MLRVGFAEVDITPGPGLPMAGMVHPPRGEGVQWPLMGRVVVFDDGIDAAAIVALDLLFLMPQAVAELRQAITPGTRVSPANVMVTCNHTHRAPYVTALMDEDIDFAYLDLVRSRLVTAFASAWVSRRPTRLRTGAADAPGWTFNRRQIYRTDLGEQVGTQGPEWIDTFVRREGPEDNQVQTLVAETPDGKALGGLVNFACHATVMGGEPLYSADYPGAWTEALAAEHGGIFAFLQGCAGNLWSYDLSSPAPIFQDGPTRARRMAEALTAKADEALAASRVLAGEQARVRAASTVLRIPQRRPTAEQVALAKWYLEKARGEVEQEEFTRRFYGHAYTFFHNSPEVQEWFMRETLGMWEWQRRVGGRELIEDVEVQAIAVGDLAFVGYPAEYFTEFGLRTKAASPFAATFVAELANGWHGYVPTVEAFAHGGYEPRLGFQSRLVPEAGDLMCDTGIALLQRLC
jgi:neutral ceramidase